MEELVYTGHILLEDGKKILVQDGFAMICNHYKAERTGNETSLIFLLCSSPLILLVSTGSDLL